MELCQLARELNSIFEIQITILIIAYLTYLTREICYMFIRIILKDDFISLAEWININIWLFYYATRIFYLNYVCESISVKVNQHIHNFEYLPPSSSAITVGNIFVFSHFSKNEIS